MPLYDYQCRACSKVTEVRHGSRETHDSACPACGGELARVFTPAGIVFKGSGFYLTDSRKSAEKAAEKASSSPKSSDAAKSSDPPKSADGAKSDGSGAPAAPAVAAPAPASSDAGPKKSESSAA